MKYDFIYDSSRVSLEKDYDFKREHYDSPIFSRCILFEQEKVYLKADAEGNAVFFDADGAELYRDKADGQGRYFSEFYCQVRDGVIHVRFPIQEVVDHYPHCNGEYDRYSYITRDNVRIFYKP